MLVLRMAICAMCKNAGQTAILREHEMRTGWAIGQARDGTAIWLNCRHGGRSAWSCQVELNSIPWAAVWLEII
jgi:hypothetical protein